MRDVPRADADDSETSEAWEPGRRLLGGGVGSRPPTAPTVAKDGTSSTPGAGKRLGSHTGSVKGTRS